MIESLLKLHPCSHCIIRCKASQKPRSLFGKIHRWHATWWPGWKLYLAELGSQGAKPAPRPSGKEGASILKAVSPSSK